MAHIVFALVSGNHHVVGLIDFDMALEKVHAANKVGHKAAVGGFVDFGGLANLQNLAFAHHANAGGHGHGLFLVVGDHDAGNAHLFNDAHQFKLRLLAQLGVEGAQGFVQQQQLRAFGQAARQSDALLLAARELVRLALGVGFELHQIEHLRHALLHLGLGHVVTAQAKGDVVPHRQVREQGVALEHHVDGPLVGRQTHDVLAA